MGSTWIVLVVAVVIVAVGAGILFQQRNGRRDSDGSAADVPDAPHGDSHSVGGSGDGGGSGGDGSGGDGGGGGD
jgi:hypothetical protein